MYELFAVPQKEGQKQRLEKVVKRVIFIYAAELFSYSTKHLMTPPISLATPWRAIKTDSYSYPVEIRVCSVSILYFSQFMVHTIWKPDIWGVEGFLHTFTNQSTHPEIQFCTHICYNIAIRIPTIAFSLYWTLPKQMWVFFILISCCWNEAVWVNKSHF